MNWTLVQPNNDSMMKKAYGGMISLDFDETEYLFIVGGKGPTPTVHHPQFRYCQLKSDRVCTNEQILYNLSTGKIIDYTYNYYHTRQFFCKELTFEQLAKSKLYKICNLFPKLPNIKLYF